MKGFVSAGRPRPRAVVGRLVLGASLGLAGCAALQDQVSTQGAELAELRTGVDGLRSDLQALRQQLAALQTAMESADRRATATPSKISTLYYDMVYSVSQALCGAPGQKRRKRWEQPAAYGHPHHPVTFCCPGHE